MAPNPKTTDPIRLYFARIIKIVCTFKPTTLKELCSVFEVTTDKTVWNYANARESSRFETALRFLANESYSSDDIFKVAMGKRTSFQEMQQRLLPNCPSDYNPKILIVPISSTPKQNWHLENHKVYIPWQEEISPVMKSWLEAEYLILFNPQEKEVARMFKIDTTNLNNVPLTREEINEKAVDKKKTYPGDDHTYFQEFPLVENLHYEIWDTDWTRVFDLGHSRTQIPFWTFLSEMFGIKIKETDDIHTQQTKEILYSLNPPSLAADSSELGSN